MWVEKRNEIKKKWEKKKRKKPCFFGKNGGKLFFFFFFFFFSNLFFFFFFFFSKPFLLLIKIQPNLLFLTILKRIKWENHYSSQFWLLEIHFVSFDFLISGKKKFKIKNWKDTNNKNWRFELCFFEKHQVGCNFKFITKQRDLLRKLKFKI